MLSYALTTRQRVKDFLDLSSTNSTEDAVIDRIIESVTEYVENYCDRRFKETSYTEESYGGNDSPYLVLKNFPVDEDSTFTLQRRSSVENDDDWDTIDTEDYFVHYDEGMVEYVPGFKFVNQPKHYQVTYTAGYDYDNSTTFLTDVGLGDLEWAVWKLCARAWYRRSGDPDVKSEKLLNYSVTYASTTQEDPEVKRVLDKYARIDVL